MSADVDILRVLQTATIAAVAASIMPNLPIKTIGRTMTDAVLLQTEGDNQKYLELVWIPNNDAAPDFWGDEEYYAGMFRLVLHWPNDGAGPYDPMTLLASVGAYFSKQNLLFMATGVLQVVSSPNSLGVLDMPTETLYPLALRYSSFRP